MEKLQCPSCKSNKITVINETLLCVNCGRSEALIDFNNSWDMGYRSEYEITAHSIEQPEPAWTKRQYDRVQQLKSEITNLRKQWYEHLKEDREYRASRKPKTKEIKPYKGVDIAAENN